jgi:hypothetical protein
MPTKVRPIPCMIAFDYRTPCLYHPNHPPDLVHPSNSRSPLVSVVLWLPPVDVAHHHVAVGLAVVERFVHGCEELRVLFRRPVENVVPEIKCVTYQGWSVHAGKS